MPLRNPYFRTDQQRHPAARDASLSDASRCHRFLGDLSEEDPPVPIPNTEVKLLSPDGTAQATVWESRKSPGLKPQSPVKTGLFCLQLLVFCSFDIPSGPPPLPPVARP